MNLLDIAGLDRSTLLHILDLSARGDLGTPLAGRGVALLFEKPSLRTRHSMEMAIVSLGGHPVTMGRDEVGLGGRESVEDVARTLGLYHHVIAARVFDHDVLERMSAGTDTPLVNMLSDRSHPLQALADLLTLRELFGDLEGLPVAWVGDGNNVCRSFAMACAIVGARLTIAAPEGYGLNDVPDGVRQTGDPAEAVRGARAVYTDAWTSMGDEQQADARRAAFAGFRVNADLMAQADNAWFLHCLPAHRGEEVDAAVIDGPGSAVWRQAKNRMGTARGVLAWICGA